MLQSNRWLLPGPKKKPRKCSSFIQWCPDPTWMILENQLRQNVLQFTRPPAKHPLNVQFLLICWYLTLNLNFRVQRTLFAQNNCYMTEGVILHEARGRVFVSFQSWQTFSFRSASCMHYVNIFQFRAEFFRLTLSQLNFRNVLSFLGKKEKPRPMRKQRKKYMLITTFSCKWITKMLHLCHHEKPAINLIASSNSLIRR